MTCSFFLDHYSSDSVRKSIHRPSESPRASYGCLVWSTSPQSPGNLMDVLGAVKW